MGSPNLDHTVNREDNIYLARDPESAGDRASGTSSSEGDKGPGGVGSPGVALAAWETSQLAWVRVK